MHSLQTCFQRSNNHLFTLLQRHTADTMVLCICSTLSNDSSFAFWGDTQSLILIDSVIDFTGLTVGSYNMVCKDRERVGLLNATACEDMAHHLPEQLRLGRSCQLAYHGEECRASYDYGQNYIHALMNNLVNAGKINLANSKSSQVIFSSFYSFTLPKAAN